jgi:glutaminase
VSELEVVVAEIVDEMRRRSDRGEVATYIPELAAVDPNQFGLAVITADGYVAAGGSATRRSRSRASRKSSR